MPFGKLAVITAFNLGLIALAAPVSVPARVSRWTGRS